MAGINKITISLIGIFPLFFFLSGCGGGEGTSSTDGKVLYTSAGARITTLDPALSSDLVSSYMVGSIYDTLLEYDYTARPYRLIPSMLEQMPEVTEDLLHYKFRLRDDLYFTEDPCFDKAKGKGDRKITSRDVVFSILRLADARAHSPGYWLIRGKIKGLDEFYTESAERDKEGLSVYDKGCEGLEIIDDRTFTIHLQKPDPRLLYGLAMPFFGTVSRKAASFYGNDFSERVIGSGAFKVVEWMRDYRIVFVKNQEYRQEFFKQATNPADRGKTLPYLDEIVCYLVKQPVSGWLLFLQGEMDMSVLDKDNIDAVMTNEMCLSPALAERGIQLIRIPEFQINYVGFCFADPVISKNLNLRKAISLAYDTKKRIIHSNNCLIPAQMAIPPGVGGYDPDFKNPYCEYDLEKAKKYLADAGYPGGIDPQTGKPLELSFDLGDTIPVYRQLAELMVDDMKKIGIKINPFLNNRPRFYQKLKEGQTQLFKVSWVGDYPDAENFLQLFYGPNIGSSNKIFYKNPEFDRMFAEIITMPDCPERTEKYRKMAEFVTEDCPWIFEAYPTSYRLVHKWLENYIPHDFAYSQWKYLSLDPKLRDKMKKSFRPLNMKELGK